MAAHGGRTACRTAGWSAVSTALLHDGRHALLILPLVLLVQLSRLAVGRTVGVRLIKQGLTRRKGNTWECAFHSSLEKEAFKYVKKRFGFYFF